MIGLTSSFLSRTFKQVVSSSNATSAYRFFRNHTYRALTTQSNDTLSKKNWQLIFNEELKGFDAVRSDISHDLAEYCKQFEAEIAPKWLVKSLEYNCYNGKKICGLALISMYKMLAKSNEITDENMKLARILAWCLEMLKGVFQTVDDVLDNAEFRRYEKCWYKLEDVGMIAINDAIMIENGIYHLLRKYFGEKDYYVDLLHIFHEFAFIGTVGQLHDLKCTGQDVSTFTMDQYKSIVSNKTASFGFLTACLAMRMAGHKDPETISQMKLIIMDLGTYFQVQNDYIDCFKPVEVSGKIASDIGEGKCTWLAVVAMEKATDAQKQIMKECYGRNDPDKVERIMQLYKDLDLPKAYESFEEETFEKICTKIQQNSGELPQELFHKCLQKIYHRNC